MTTREILEAARDRISDRSRWCVGTVDDNEGRHCAMGAIAVVGSGCAWDTNHPDVYAALKAYSRVLPADIGCAWSPQSRISVFNNQRGHECVMAAFDAAIQKEIEV